jgi:hypothetical protein
MRRLKPFQPSVLTTGAAVATTLVVASATGMAQLSPARGLHTASLTPPCSQLIIRVPVTQTNKEQQPA